VGVRSCGCSSLLLAAVKGGSLDILRSLIAAGEGQGRGGDLTD
jgi:hypothetical protein